VFEQSLSGVACDRWIVHVRPRRQRGQRKHAGGASQGADESPG
jgi:hypothetical protein